MLDSVRSAVADHWDMLFENILNFIFLCRNLFCRWGIWSGGFSWFSGLKGKGQSTGRKIYKHVEQVTHFSEKKNDK